MDDTARATAAKRAYNDLQEHIAALDKAGLLTTIDAPINKDTEMHPLVRWQFRGGIPEPERKAFLFTNVTDSRGRKYDIPVLVGGLAANPENYRIGMGAKTLDEIGPKMVYGHGQPDQPTLVTQAPCQEVVLQGKDIQGEGKGREAQPIPI
jgi:4-hydroxy-3-polyprenylbenzoate decarboxylase